MSNDSVISSGASLIEMRSDHSEIAGVSCSFKMQKSRHNWSGSLPEVSASVIFLPANGRLHLVILSIAWGMAAQNCPQTIAASAELHSYCPQLAALKSP
jgi:hypothetical protein